MKRILFVDDEPSLLAGLRRMLRPKRKEWEMRFLDSGHAALKAIAERPPDVLVTDMRMPFMDGGELLAKVHANHPQVVRIVLSGYTELEAALRAVPIAHQFLTKPTDTDTLCQTIERACSLQGLLLGEALKGAVSRMKSLPSVPALHSRLTQLLAQDDVSITDVAELIESDPGMSAKVLQVVNSAFFGVPRRISQVREASSRLGTTMLRNLVLTSSAFAAFDVPGDFDIEATQAHSMRVGRLAMEMHQNKQQRDDSFTAGVLLQVGKLVAASEQPEAFGRVERLTAQGLDPIIAQNRVLGASYGHLGAYLLGLWGLPYPIVEAVAHHQELPPTSKRFDVATAVLLADTLVGDPEAEVDTDSLRTQGVLEQLPKWRQLATESAAAA